MDGFFIDPHTFHTIVPMEVEHAMRNEIKGVGVAHINYFCYGGAMLKVRLQRVGRRNDPSFRVVVTDSKRGPKSGNYIEMLGSYNPRQKVIALNGDRIKYWMSVGAKVTGTVHNILIKENITTGKKINVLPKKTPIKKEIAGEAVKDKVDPHTFHTIVPTEVERAKRDDIKGVGVDVEDNQKSVGEVTAEQGEEPTVKGNGADGGTSSEEPEEAKAHDVGTGLGEDGGDSKKTSK